MIDRVWLPSPATVIGLPVSACEAKAGIARPVVRPHPRAVRVEDPHDRGVDPVRAPVGHRQRLGEALRLVVHPARPDRVHVPPVRLGLRVDLRVAVGLRRRGQQEARALLLAEPSACSVPSEPTFIVSIGRSR
jgi:hypothetical protein